jgi:hypothetical protein
MGTRVVRQHQRPVEEAIFWWESIRLGGQRSELCRCSLLNYDTVYGRSRKKVKAASADLSADEKANSVFSENDSARLFRQKLNIRAHVTSARDGHRGGEE